MGGEVLNNEGMPLAELKQETIPISRSESSESLNSLTSTRSSSGAIGQRHISVTMMAVIRHLQDLQF